MDCLSVHHLQVLSQHVLVRDFRIPNGVRILQRIIGKDAVDAGRLDDDIGIDFTSPQGGRRVGRDERAARPRGQDHDTALLQVPDTAPANERFSHRRNRDRALNSRRNPEMFHHVLQSQGVDRRGQHTHVMSR